MSKRSWLILAFAALLCAPAPPARAHAGVTAQGGARTVARPVAQAQTNAPAGAADSPAPTEEERRLVAGSRAAILSAGLSETYFDRHFAVAKVVNTAGDRRVVWRFRAGEHEALVGDTIGFYTDDKGRRVYTHSITGSLGAAREIGRTITRRRAERLMRACIGPFDGGSVFYQSAGSPPRAALVFSAVSAAAPAQSPARASVGNQTLPQRPPAAAAAGSAPEADVVKPGGKKPAPPLIGAVDLQTGRCTVGYGLAGAYPPLPPARRAPRRRN